LVDMFPKIQNQHRHRDPLRGNGH